MNFSSKLQDGGTLIPGKHIYVAREEDEQIYCRLRDGEYVNILSSRQVGKSSLVMRIMRRLEDHEDVQTAYVDLAAKLGMMSDQDVYYQGLLKVICDGLGLLVDVEQFWQDSGAEPPNQRLMRFFREVVGKQIKQSIVIFLDEIDSSFSRAFSDDLFTVLRGIFNERALVPSYQRITFCLIGVATPNELIKERRTTPYNIGRTFELCDFNAAKNDLSPFAQAISADLAVGQEMLERLLDWTGGHPYLTVKLCIELEVAGVDTASGVDRHIEQTFHSLEGVTSDVHFQQILRFLEERLSEPLASFDLYVRLLEGERERDQTAPAYLELKLSGLIKRNEAGYLVCRNRIYRRLFDKDWADSKRRHSELEAPAVKRKQKRVRDTRMVALLFAVMTMVLWLADDSRRAKIAFTWGLYPLDEPKMMALNAEEFEIGVYEVTFDQYDQFALVKGHSLPNDEGWGRGKRPVINVSWSDANAYADWLTEQTGTTYRLPSNNEWESAVIETTLDNNDSLCKKANVFDLTGEEKVKKKYSFINWEPVCCNDGFAFTAPVGKFEPNRLKLYDMFGNVWEWTLECDERDYNDPQEDCLGYVVRGGSWSDGRQPYSTTRSSAFLRATRNSDIGFRLVRER